jgi:hypothetical protein
MFNRPAISILLLLFFFQLRLDAQPCPVAWGPTEQISSTEASAFGPKIAVVGDTVHVVYHAGGVYYRRSADGGKTWGLQTELVSDDSMSGSLWKSPLAAFGSSVAFVWGNIRSSGVRSIKIIRSTDAGETWLEPQVLAVNEGTVSFDAPMVTMREDQIFVTMNRYVIPSYQYFMTRSFDGGVNWDSVRQITTFPESHGSLGDIGVTADRVVLTYERATQPSGREIWFMGSSDSGTTWSDEEIISEIDDYDGWEPNVAADGEGNVYITWQDVKYGSFGFTGTVLMRRSTDNGLTWGPEIRVSDPPSAVRSSLSVDRNVIHVVWDDERSGILTKTIQYRGSTDGGLTWCPEFTVGDTLEVVLGGFVASLEGAVHVTYSSSLASLGGADVFYRSGLCSVTSVNSSPGGSHSSSFQLWGNYPNPFNAQTTIVYEIPWRTHVRIGLFDLLGRELRVLADHIVEAGMQRVTVNADGLSSGVYYIGFFTETTEEMRPIVLIK